MVDDDLQRFLHVYDADDAPVQVRGLTPTPQRCTHVRCLHRQLRAPHWGAARITLVLCGHQQFVVSACSCGFQSWVSVMCASPWLFARPLARRLAGGPLSQFLIAHCPCVMH
jgi:hypothetical protein